MLRAAVEQFIGKTDKEIQVKIYITYPEVLEYRRPQPLYVE